MTKKLSTEYNSVCETVFDIRDSHELIEISPVTPSGVALFFACLVFPVCSACIWFFAINDIVEVLTQTPNVSDYIKKMRQRDPELGKGWGQIVTPLSIKTTGGVQKLNCANLQGIFRIIQSVPSSKAEPFRLWLAQVGQDRIEEIQDPERAIVRAKRIYEQKGYNDDWIAKCKRTPDQTSLAESPFTIKFIVYVSRFL